MASPACKNWIHTCRSKLSTSPRLRWENLPDTSIFGGKPTFSCSLWIRWSSNGFCWGSSLVRRAIRAKNSMTILPLPRTWTTTKIETLFMCAEYIIVYLGMIWLICLSNFLNPHIVGWHTMTYPILVGPHPCAQDKVDSILAKRWDRISRDGVPGCKGESVGFSPIFGWLKLWFPCFFFLLGGMWGSTQWL